MKRGLTPDMVLAAVDGILEVPQDPDEANSLWRKLDPMLDRMLAATRVDPVRHRHLSHILTRLRVAASEFTQSLTNAKRGGTMRGDWMRLAERDLIKLKDELLALREFMVREVEFLRLICLKANLEGSKKINPEKLFEELHEAGAISERTWTLLMARSSSWQKALKDRELFRRLVRISGWLLDLHEARREGGVVVPEQER